MEPKKKIVLTKSHPYTSGSIQEPYSHHNDNIAWLLYRGMISNNNILCVLIIKLVTKLTISLMYYTLVYCVNIICLENILVMYFSIGRETAHSSLLYLFCLKEPYLMSASTL